MASGYHPGELAAQRRAGLRAEADRVGGIVRTDVPRRPPRSSPSSACWSSAVPTSGAGCGAHCSPASRLPAGRDRRRRGGHRHRGAPTSRRPTGRRPHPAHPDRGHRAGPRHAAQDADQRIAEPTGTGLRLTPSRSTRTARSTSSDASWSPPGPAAERLPRRCRRSWRGRRRMITEADTFFIVSTSADGHRDASHRGGTPASCASPPTVG